MSFNSFFGKCLIKLEFSLLEAENKKNNHLFLTKEQVRSAKGKMFWENSFETDVLSIFSEFFFSFQSYLCCFVTYSLSWKY